MAKGIEPTPVLSGKDAENFLKQMREEETHPNAQKARFLEECFLLYSQRKP